MIDKQNTGSPGRNEQLTKIRHQPGELLEMYRRRGNLSQAQLAGFLGLKSERMPQKWEGDYALPSADKLKKLIEIYLAHELFQVGRETVEARQLWQTIKKFFDASRERRLDTYPLFDELWFATLLTTVHTSQPIAKEPPSAPNLTLLSAKTHKPTNLPATLNRLIGREAELLQVSNLLEQQRLVTLTGPGGTGKTRLALAVASQLNKEFKDGAWWVELATVTDPAQVAPVIAQILGLQETAGQTPTENLKSYLHDREILLVLDNFEQVITAAALVTTLLAAALALKILVTSRETLHVYSEQKFIVPPLTLPLLDHKPALPQLSQNPAIQLFVLRARLAQPDFELTAANVGAVAKLCIFLEGLPLAIELAAAQSEFFTPAALLGQLQDSQEAVRLRRLVDGPRDVAPRQQTLRNTLEWGFRLLEPDEQQLFAELGVFVGGWTVEAASAICTDLALATMPMLKRLQKLSAKSLLTVAPNAEGAPRFGMLETIREFALESLVASPELEVIRRKHCEYYLKVAELADAERRNSGHLQRLSQLKPEYNNLHSVLQWLVALPLADTWATEKALRLSLALYAFWYAYTYYNKGYQWMKRVLDRASLNADSTAKAVITELKVKVLSKSGILLAQLKQNEPALVLLEQSYLLARNLNDKQFLSDCLYNYGEVLVQTGQFARAVTLYEECSQLYQELEDEVGVVTTLNGLGLAALFQGDNRQAAYYFEQGYKSAKIYDKIYYCTALLTNFAFAIFFDGKYHEAEVAFRESMSLSVSSSLSFIILLNLYGLGGVAGAHGQTLQNLQRAAKLLGAGEIYGEAFDLKLSPAQQVIADTLISTTQNQLDPASWQQAWNAGRAMTPDQIITFALE